MQNFLKAGVVGVLSLGFLGGGALIQPVSGQQLFKEPVSSPVHFVFQREKRMEMGCFEMKFRAHVRGGPFSKIEVTSEKGWLDTGFSEKSRALSLFPSPKISFRYSLDGILNPQQEQELDMVTVACYQLDSEVPAYTCWLRFTSPEPGIAMAVVVSSETGQEQEAAGENLARPA